MGIVDSAFPIVQFLYDCTLEYPVYFGILAGFVTLSKYYLIWSIVFNALVLLAVAAIYALATLISDTISKRDTIGKLRDGVHFFHSTTEARLVAANRGRPIRQFPLSSRSGWVAVYTTRQRERQPFSRRKYIDNSELQQQVDEIVQYISRDFVRSWYNQFISREIIFVNRVEGVLHHALSEVSTRIEKTDLLPFIISKVFSALTNHIREFYKAERLLRAERLHTEQDAIDVNLAKLYLGGSLHPAVSLTGVINPSNLRSHFNSIVPFLIPKTDCSSQILTILVREILVCRVLVPVIDLFSDPDYWNQTFESLADTLFPEESALAMKQFEGDKEAGFPDDFFLDDEGSRPPSFEEYIKKIKECDNLLDAFRIRDIITAEISKKSHEIVDCDNDDIINGVKVSGIRVYINQLRIAQRRIDRRIAALGGKQKKQKGISDAMMDSRNSRLKLAYILEDPHSLSYLTEFMDQRQRLGYLQYLMIARGLREQLGLDPNSTTPFSQGMIATASQTWNIAALSEDIRSIWRDYFAPGASSFIPDISSETKRGLETVVDMLAVGDASLAEDVLVSDRGLEYVFQAQKEIMTILERVDYPSFLKSPLCNQLIAHFKKEQSMISFSSDRKSRRKSGIAQKDTDKPPSLKSGNVSDVYRTSESEIEDNEGGVVRRLSKRRPLKIIDSVFKRKKKESTGIRFNQVDGERIMNITQNIPKVTSGVENVEKELLSILDDDDDSMFNRVKDFGTSSNQRHDPADISKDILMEDKQLDALLSQDSLVDSFPQSQLELVSEVKFPTRAPFDEASSAPDLNTNPFLVDSDIAIGTQNETSAQQNQLQQKPILIPPKSVVTLERRIQSVKAEIDHTDSKLNTLIKNDSDDQEQIRHLTWMKTGMKIEYEQLLQERYKLEREEIMNLILPDTVTVTIQDPFTMSEERTIYPITVQRRNTDGAISSWTVNRRFSEFTSLHNLLRTKYPHLLLHLELPGRNALLKKKRDQRDERHIALEKYLQALLKHADICKTSEFKKFICHPDIYKLIIRVDEAMEGGPSKKSFLRNIFQTVDDGFDTLFHRQKREYVANASPATFIGPRGPGVSEPLQPSMGSDMPSLFNPLMNDPFSTGGFDVIQQASATDALIDLFIEIFELKEKNNWLRRQAVVLFLQQVFGGTVERRLSETIRSLLTEETALSISSSIKDSLWPKGEFKYPESTRTSEMKQKSRRDAVQKLSSVLPEYIGGVVGRQNAKRGAARWCSAFQNKILNQHLISGILDDLLSVLFPDLKRV